MMDFELKMLMIQMKRAKLTKFVEKNLALAQGGLPEQPISRRTSGADQSGQAAKQVCRLYFSWNVDFDNDVDFDNNCKIMK